MAYPGTHLRLVVSGDLPGGEAFSWSLNFHGNFSTPDAPEEVPQELIDALTTFHTDQRLPMSSSAVMTTIKLNEIGPDGRYVNRSETVLHEFETGIPGYASGGLPNQCALAVTLRTAARRGLAHSGRFYLPYLRGLQNNGGQIVSAAADSIADQVTVLLNSLNAALDPWRVSVMSDVRDGAARPVTHVEVGRVVDTIRSRRTSIPEAYVVGDPLAP